MQKITNLFERRSVTRIILLAFLSIFTLFGNAQNNHSISGTIVDSKGEGLIGVSVIFVEGEVGGTITDLDGKFNLNLPAAVKSLKFSYMGYEEQTIVVGDKKTLNITLKEDLIGLEELVVVGYGSVKKSDLTGAVTQVNSESIAKSTSANIDQRLQGLAAGVLVTTDSNQPGGGVSIRVRGTSSLNAGSDPLYVIDGVAIDNSMEESGGIEGVTISPLAAINPDDIESIEVLKDASSTAIYGARGSNGVVLITTKKGENGRNVISVNTSVSIQDITNRLDVMDATQYMNAFNQGLRNDLGYTFHPTLVTTSGTLTDVFTWNGSEDELNPNEYFSDDEIANSPNTNWQDEIFTKGLTQNYSVNASGGTKTSKYFISLGRTDIDGIIKNSDFGRTSLRVNYSKKINKLSIGENVSLTDIKSNFIRTEGERQNAGVGSVITSALRYRPNKAVTQIGENGEEEYFQDDALLMSNPAALTEKVTNETNRLRFFGNVYAQYNFSKSFFVKSTGGFDYSNNRDQFYTPQEGTYLGAISNGYAKIGYLQNRKFSLTNLMHYHKDFKKHAFKATGVNEIITARSDRMLNIASGFSNDVLREYDMGAASSISPPQNYTQDYSLASFLGRINYSYKDRYLLTASARYDGSSRFGINNKWAFFPSAALAWRADQEDFIKNIYWLSNLKLRASYGVVGNQNIALYSSTSPLASSSYILNNTAVTGYYPTNIANPDLRWERKNQFNVGVDFGFLTNRINGSLEYYMDRTEDLLINKPVPISSGFGTIMSNLGTIENTGIELTLSTVNIKKSKLSWVTNFNIALPKNKVVNIGGIDEFPAGLSSGQGIINTQRLVVGQPVGQFYGYRFKGVATKPEDLAYTTTGQYGSYMFEDLSGPDGVADNDISPTYDKEIIGDANPIFFGGITNTLNYDNWTFSFFFQGTYGNDIMNMTKALLTTGGILGNQMVDVIDAWEPEIVDITTGEVINAGNPDGKGAMLGTGGRNPEDTNTSYLEDGSYIRLKNVALSYSLPQNICSKLKMSSIRLTLSGTNLLTFTNYSGYDPEVDSKRNGSLAFGHDYFSYPQSKSYNVSVGVTF